MFNTINVGSGDRMFRIVLALALIILPFVIPVVGILRWIMIIAGIVFLVTAATRSCPIYSVTGMNTAKDK